MKIGFDHEKYTRMQSEHILERIEKFGGKLYLELGGKLSAGRYPIQSGFSKQVNKVRWIFRFL